MSHKKVVILVPVYKNRLSLFEKISLKQLFRVLGDYPICIVAPTGFTPKYDELLERKYEIKFFPERYFKSVEGYSELLLEKDFYERFQEYEYILLHQLDCFIFRDMLNDFCNQGFDYIGAPIHQDSGFWSQFHVGNGGLSLRNVKKCIQILDKKDMVFRNHPYPDLINKAEDTFFSYCGGEAEYDFSIPPVEVAETFSLYVDSEEKKKSICENGLPFGIHYFPKYYYDFWRPFIQIYGYSLPETASQEKDRRYLVMMNQWMINAGKGRNIGEYLRQKGYNTIAIYGMSVYARHLIRELDGHKVKVKYGIDRWNNSQNDGVLVYRPDAIPDDKVDAVINTVIWDHHSIERDMSQLLGCPILSLEDVVFEEYWDGD